MAAGSWGAECPDELFNLTQLAEVSLAAAAAQGHHFTSGTSNQVTNLNVTHWLALSLRPLKRPYPRGCPLIMSSFKGVQILAERGVIYGQHPITKRGGHRGP